jgi:RNA polymerase sigma-70 factor (ECF subfamily)
MTTYANTNARQATRMWTLAQPTVSAYVASVVRDTTERDDLLQEVAVSVIESFDRYDSDRPFVGWALGIAHNHVKQYFHRVKRDRRVFDLNTISAITDAFAKVSETQTQQLDHLRDCLGALDGRSKEMCDLRYRNDFKPAAIAEALGMTANSVAKALQRIRTQLRNCVARKSAWRDATT